MFKQRYGDFYEGLRPESRQALLFNFYFVTRRWILVITLVMFEQVVVF